MHAKDAIRSCLDMSDRVIKTYLEDLSDADLKVKPVEGMNPIGWQLGHLVSSERAMMEGVKAGSSPALPAGFDEVHGRDNPGGVDVEKFSTKQEYLRLIDAQRAATKALLDSLSDADLDAPAPERMRPIAPTVGALMLLAGNHYLMHAGQFVPVRRKTGKPVSI
jgi:hypothetical protein